MEKDPKIFLQHIDESIKWIENYTEDLSKDAFFESVQIQDAVMRRLEIIGEAVKNLPTDFKDSHIEIPWQKIAGMRDVLIHDYFGVETKLVWNTVKRDLPELKKRIDKIIADEKEVQK